MAKRVKTKEHEKLDDTNVQNVIDLLESDNPITKKAACEILNISYNTTRLNNIIESYKETQERIQKLKAKNRGKPASTQEIVRAIEEYLEGDAITEIAKGMYRSSAFVKSILNNYNVPIRSSSTDYFKPELIPDEATSESFEAGELVWSSRYNTTAEIIGHKAKDPKFSKFDNNGIIQDHPIHGKCYRIWLFGNNAQYAIQPWYELGKLEHLKKLGVKL